ncbi:MAG: hypothetical protein WAZ77_01815 [Candidatus Nitrosopolaris sp.]
MKKKSKEKGQNTRDLYTYIAIPKWQEYAEKYGINDFNNLVKNLLGEFMAHYERGHTFIKARDWAVEHIKDNRFGKTSYDRAGQRDKVQRLMENVDRLREDQEETLKYVIENLSMITELLESLKSSEEEKKRPNFPNP